MDHIEERDEQPLAPEHHEDVNPDNGESSPARRTFLKSVATVGAGLVLAPGISEAADTTKKLPTAKQLKAQVAKSGQGQTMKAAPHVKPPNPVKPKPPTAKAPKPDDIKIAMIGPGNQGRNLLVNCLRVPGVRFTAICDIWPYSQQYASGILRSFGQPVNVYADYREMLEKEKDLDAVVIATPDWMHAEHTIACLRAGKHVYCEKEMSNDLE
ncbi:MAG: Gfo/Idh/MocA family oxidoreductase, partial [Abitibacteriaceae bacterium]|nr:Gfo/Idh/MocA family oxidoreductase [Abditibacteriaceae bacterium]